VSYNFLRQAVQKGPFFDFRIGPFLFLCPCFFSELNSYWKQ